jgi:hypothetical protein
MSGLNGLSTSQVWRLLVAAATRSMRSQGFVLTRKPGRGLANVWMVSKGAGTSTVSIRTTRDRMFAFVPLSGGSKWKTLDDVDNVLVAAVDSKDNPQRIEVYLFPGPEVRTRFKAAQMARVAAGNAVPDGFGMWVNLDIGHKGTAHDVGSGLAKAYKPMTTYAIADLRAELGLNNAATDGSRKVETAQPATPVQSQTIAEVMSWARTRIAQIAGVGPDAVKLDLKLEL